jgi:hypothetical protein
MSSIAILAQASFHFPVKFLWPLMPHQSAPSKRGERRQRKKERLASAESAAKGDEEVDLMLTRFGDWQRCDAEVQKNKDKLAMSNKLLRLAIAKVVEERRQEAGAPDLNRMD